MPQAARVNFNVQNFTSGVNIPTEVVMYVIGSTLRGPVMQPDLPESYINNITKLKRVFGGPVPGSDFYLLCKQAISSGAVLRICRVDTETPSSVVASPIEVKNSSDNVLFTVTPKYAGAFYNNFKISVGLPTNGESDDYFDLQIVCESDPSLNEQYRNISIPESGANTEGQTFLNNIYSPHFKFGYQDLTSIDDTKPVVVGGVSFEGGVDPGALTDADYISAFDTFDDLDDGSIITVLDSSEVSVHNAGALYALGRGDLVYFAHLSNSIKLADDLITARAEIINTKHVAIFGGGLKIQNPIKPNELLEISEMGAILGIAAKVHNDFGPWFSLAGYNRGRVTTAMGVVNNFGTPAKFTELNQLANAQINMMTVKNGEVQLSGNFSGQKENDLERFLSVVFLVLYLKRVLVPVLNEYLEEPNDPITFRAIYMRLVGLLDDLTSPSKRAIYRYDYQGDQDANSLDDLQINDPIDVQNGKYKINLKIWPIPSMQELNFNLMLVQGEGATIE